MRSKFIYAIHDLCYRRSTQSSAIKWWFAEVKARNAHRVGASEWSEEHTQPLGRDPLTPTIEDPPLAVDFWQSLKVG